LRPSARRLGRVALRGLERGLELRAAELGGRRAARRGLGETLRNALGELDRIPAVLRERLPEDLRELARVGAEGMPAIQGSE
jgi:hypothetical protein